MNKLLIASALLVALSCGHTEQKLNPSPLFHGEGCESDHLFQSRFKPQVLAIAPDISRIISYVLKGKHASATYEALAYFVDKFGPRFTGTKSLEDSIDYMLELLKKEGHDNVHGENVSVPKWNRGNEWAAMVKPRHKKLNILGLGYSVGTNNQTLQAPIVVVSSFEELDRRASEVKGKIVVYNFKFESYGAQVPFRGYGASHAAKHGAVAALIRSLTPLSINSVHTGVQRYDTNYTKIPAISITVEDAELFQRLTNRKEEVVVQIYSENYLEPNEVTSRNTVSELTGSKYPNQVVMVSGHLDSWDVGQGAMDDGAGAFISWQALSVLKQLGLKPKRTLRSVLWTAEEMGLFGAAEYTKRHRTEMSNIVIAMESDFGTFTPTGITYSGTNLTAQCTVHEIMKLMAPINATELALKPDGSDVMYLYGEGVPVSSLDNQNDNYFYYHHSEGDTMSALNSTDLDKCLAVWTSVAYAFATIEDPLPDDRKHKQIG